MCLLGIPNTKPPTKFEVSTSNSFGDMFDRIPKIVGSRYLGHAHFQGKLFVRPLGIPDTSCTLNLKSLAQVVFEILRFKHVGVTSLTFQGRMRSPLVRSAKNCHPC